MPRDIARRLQSPAAFHGAQAASRASPGAFAGAHAGPRARRPRVAIATLLWAALGWLLFGCLGLLWTIAFTTDPRSMTIGLAVWVFCFVVPSMLATVVAYRVEERISERREHLDLGSARRRPISAAGD